MGKCGFNPCEALNPKLTSPINLLPSHGITDPSLAPCVLPESKGCQIGAVRWNNNNKFMYFGKSDTFVKLLLFCSLFKRSLRTIFHEFQSFFGTQYVPLLLQLQFAIWLSDSTSPLHEYQLNSCFNKKD